MGIRHCAAVALVLLCAAGVGARDLLFLGLTDIRGRPVQAELEAALRHEFTVNPAFGMVSELETQRIVREIERLGRSHTESWLPPGAGIRDSVIVVKGVVEEGSMETVRHWLAWGKINARMNITLYFNEAAGAAAYQGRFGATASKPKDFILFQNPKTAVQISAIDRSELQHAMQKKIVKDVSDFTSRWLKTLSAEKRVAERAADTPVKKSEEKPADDSTATVESVIPVPDTTAGPAE
ncbi:MAG: hypothetical protein FWB85_09340 [Chitinispirillia bacterium]|nr:hypothetical protein [Chitinispirillia bacterium]MCL2241201.1 hypothetical protein [Chitinispirillia bacterium]